MTTKIMKKLFIVFFFLFSLFFIPSTFAADNAFVSIVNPIRGKDFWDLKNTQPETAVGGQISILQKFNLSATWLIRFDALDDQNIIQELKKRPLDEKGLFLEVTPTWTTEARVKYQQSNSWHSAGSAFLTGYERAEREKLIDTSFEKFKSIFDSYPLSVGAWWIDSYSLDYMQKKYGTISALIVSDQYSTDNYQIWGQYFSTPYYPSKENALHPAQTLEDKLDVVMTQWAPRDPVNSYGNGVMESTFSVQANDYMDYHNLDTKYFLSLLDIYTKQQFNPFAHLVVGLENSYEWNKYSAEYQKQIEVLADKKNSKELSVVSLSDFAKWYKSSFPKLSPSQIIIATDPLGSVKKTVWFMDPYYRVGWFYNQDGSSFRDIRQYVIGEEELCFKTRCDSVNFATSATRVLDDVSFGHKWLIDQGKIINFQVTKQADEFIISYKNEAGTLRQIGLLPRDISIDNKIFSIDAAILNATKKENITSQVFSTVDSSLKWSFFSVISKTLKFLLFFILAIYVPGTVFSNKFFSKDSPFLLRLFVASVVGVVVLTLSFYIASLLKLRLLLIFAYLTISLIIFIRFKFYRLIKNLPRIKQSIDLILILIILTGVIFQTTPTFKSGLTFGYGIGFWGPNTHDGVWHLALINQLVKSVPPENPIYSGILLKNYHFFYDLFVALTNYLSKIPVSDLVFRFYPLVFSLLLGLGSYYLIMRLFESRLGTLKAKVTAIFSLYLIYFAGSFGWIVEFLRERHFGGESAFWVNQSVSFNLNPPFAISLLIMVALLHILFNSPFKGISKVIIILIIGTLISFKSYTGVLVLGVMIVVSLIRFLAKRDFSYFWIIFLSSLLAGWLFISNFEMSSSFLKFAPFWFIHSMVDSPDRVGWVRLSLARTSSQVLRQWPKFILVELLSLLIFIFGNLGLRFFGLVLTIKKKDIFRNDSLLFIFVVTILSVLIPILFIQSGNPWNTIQFFYPVLYTTALLSGLTISTLLFKLNRLFACILICVVVILAPINSLVTASGYFGNSPHAFISVSELEGLKFLATQPDGVILTYPYEEKLKTKLKEPWPILAYDSTSYVSAFSKKGVYLEDESQNQILLTDYKKRVVASKDFFLKPITEDMRFLRDNHIKYVFLPKIMNIKLDESAKVVKNIFENEEVIIYGVNQ